MRVRGALVLVAVALAGRFLWFALRVRQVSSGLPGEEREAVGATLRDPGEVQRVVREAPRPDPDVLPEPGLVTADELFARRVSPKREVTIAGRVVDRRMKGIPEARLLLEQERGQGEVARSGTDGRFEIACTALAGGDRILAVADGFAATARDLPVRVPGFVRLGDLILAPGGSVTGTVLDAGGRPVPGTTVLAYPARAMPESPLSIPEAEPGVLRARTGDDGRFRLDGIPAGERFLAARTWEGSGVSEVVDVRPGAVPNVPIVLVPDPEAIDTSLPIRGIVVDHEGRPVETLTVSCGDDSDATDAAGAFHLACDEGHPVPLRVTDGVWRHATRSFAGIVPGSEDVVLTLAEPDIFEIALVDAQGSPVRGGRVWPFHDRNVPVLPLDLGEAWRVRLVKPPFAFSPAAVAPGFHWKKVGPFDPRTVERVEIVLERGGFVSGRVVQAGLPVAGATVTGLRPRPCAASVPPERGFAVCATVLTEPTTTDDDGTFLLPVDESGSLSVRLWRGDLGACVLGGIDVNAETGLAGVGLDWPPAGAIEGRVLLAAGERSAGRFVGASDGSGFVHTTEVGEDGSFRLEGLGAGRYQLRAVEPPVGDWFQLPPEWNGGSGKDSPPPTWDCRVTSGATTRFDLDLRGEVTCVLVGELRLGGVAPAFWDAELSREGIVVDEVDCELGRFRLVSRHAGPHELRLSGDALGLRLTLDLVPGETRRVVDVPMGRVRVTHAPDDDGQALRAIGEVVPGLTVSGGLSGEGEAVPFPAGSFTLERVRFFPRSMTAAGTLEVRTGEETVVEWPR